MVRSYKPKLGHRVNWNYTQESLNKAVRLVLNGTLSVRTAEKKYKVSKSTISSYVKELREHLEAGHEVSLSVPVPKVGHPTVLSAEEEKDLTECICIAAEYGYSCDRTMIKSIVKMYLDRAGRRKTQFVNNEPGDDWVSGFLLRNKVLKMKVLENVNRSHAAVSAESVKHYLENLNNLIETENIEPDLVLNYDETNLTDNPKKMKVIVHQSSRHAHNIIDVSKSSHSVMFCGSAAGTLLPIYIVFKGETLFESWGAAGPKHARYGKSSSGWFDGDLFENWFCTVVLPYFRRKDPQDTKCKLLIGDNCSIHFSAHVLKLCKQHKIHFTYLPANSTGLLQPLDIAYFRPLKLYWSNALLQWKKTHKGIVPKSEVPRLLKEALMQIDSSKNLRAGFEACGIYLFNIQKPLSRLPQLCTSESTSNKLLWTESVRKVFEVQRFGATSATSTRGRRKRVQVSPGKSVSQRDIGFSSSDSEDLHLPDHPHSTNNEISDDVVESYVAPCLDSVLSENVAPKKSSVPSLNISSVSSPVPCSSSGLSSALSIYKNEVKNRVAADKKSFTGEHLKTDSKTSTFVFPWVRQEEIISTTNVISVVEVLSCHRGHYNFSDTIYDLCARTY